LKKIKFESQFDQLKELIRFNDLIKLLMSLIDLIKDLIKAKISLQVNLSKIWRIN